MAANPNMHWSDVMIQAEKSRVVEIKDVIQARLNKIYAEHLAKSDMMRPHSSGSPLKPLSGLDSIQKISAMSPSPHASNAQIIETNREDVEEQDGEEQKGADGEKPPETSVSQMSPDELILQYGPETMSELAYLISHSFKVFWDGSISLFKDTVHSSTNNKEFLNKLLDIRMHSD